jgi:hypothetical protein
MRDTSKIHDEIHVSQMHPDRDVSDMKETCGIHSRYMQDTCILRGNQDTCCIHNGYMRDTEELVPAPLAIGIADARALMGIKAIECLWALP